jgi:hypothetical protein
MALDPDPYRTLGLKRGATLDEVKRAYRRLAKINHPDAGGEKALPRFLAIQAAYEQLAGPGVPGAARPTPAPRRPWDAEADKTRRAYGGRGRNASPGAGTGGAGGATGKGGAAGADGEAGGAGTPGAGSGGWARRPGSGARASGASGRPGRRRTYEPRPDQGTSGTPPPGGKTREPNKATLGSTSYDGADTGPFEPNWGGASWYGTTSGTYWTLNPKEYADPRKHGPEYQARARRAARARGTDPSSPAPDPEAAAGPAAGDPGDPAGGDRPADPTHTTSSWWDSTAGPAGEPEAAAGPGTAADPSPGAPPRDADAPPRDADARNQSGARLPRTEERPPPDLGRAAADITHALTDDRFGGSRGRLGRALIGWLPIALGLSWLVGEMTGCGRFAATCDDGVAGPMLFVLQILAFVLLLAIPAAGSITTMAALTLVGAAVVASLVLSASGGAADGDSRRTVLGVILLLAWLAGLGIAIARRARTLRSGTSPVS